MNDVGADREEDAMLLPLAPADHFQNGPNLESAIALLGSELKAAIASSSRRVVEKGDKGDKGDPGPPAAAAPPAARRPWRAIVVRDPDTNLIAYVDIIPME